MNGAGIQEQRVNGRPKLCYNEQNHEDCVINTFAAIIMLHNINDRVQHWVDEAQTSGASMSEEDQYVMWKTMYDMVFSDDISGRAFEMIQDAGLSMDYYDPDTSYQEDVEAFARALKWLCDDNPLFVPEPAARSLSL